MEDNKKTVDEAVQKLNALKKENGSLTASIAEHSNTLSKNKAYIDKLLIELEQKNAVIDEIDAAAVKISIELDKLSVEYNELCNKYEELYISTKGIEEYKKKAESYDKILKRAMEKNGVAFHCTSTAGAERSFPDTAIQIVDKMRESQMKFSAAVANLQNETESLKDQINKLLEY